MSTLSTREKILNCTEELIAETGFSALSVRKISHKACTNLAAINYHFGNKQYLINEMLERRLNNLFAIRQRLLDELNPDGEEPCLLEDILHAFIAPALMMVNDHHQGGRRFMKVLARAYAEQSEHLHELLSQRYSGVVKQFARAIHKACPHLDENTVFWRFHFIIGSMTYVMSDFGGSSLSSQMNESEYFQQSTKQLIDFATNALKA